MGKGSRIRNRARGNAPAKHIPYPVQNRILREDRAELKKTLNKLMRLLWLAVYQNKGRIEIPQSDYYMAMQAPDEDVITKVDYDEEGKMLAIVLCDKDGNRLPESDKPLVILTDGK